MFRSSKCVEAAYNELDIMFDKVEEQPDVYLTGISVENLEDGFMFACQCNEDYQIQMIAVLVEEVEETKVERLIEHLAEINRDLRFFSLFLDDNNNVVLSYTYYLVHSFEESKHQLISLMNSAMDAINAFIPDVLTYV